MLVESIAVAHPRVRDLTFREIDAVVGALEEVYRGSYGDCLTIAYGMQEDWDGTVDNHFPENSWWWYFSVEVEWAGEPGTVSSENMFFVGPLTS
jgi:hypothetical protein